MVVTRIKEDTARRVSRTGAGSEQVLKIAIKKKILISVLSLAIIVAMVLFIFFYLFWVS